jgi:uroporphyrinogen decarboxylase
LKAFSIPSKPACPIWTRENLEIFKSGGGYVFNNVHDIQVGVPPENIVALFDAAYEFGFND